MGCMITPQLKFPDLITFVIVIDYHNYNNKTDNKI